MGSTARPFGTLFEIYNGTTECLLVYIENIPNDGARRILTAAFQSQLTPV